MRTFFIIIFCIYNLFSFQVLAENNSSEFNSITTIKTQENKIKISFAEELQDSINKELLPSIILGENNNKLIIDLKKITFPELFFSTEWNNLNFRISQIIDTSNQEPFVRILIEGNENQINNISFIKNNNEIEFLISQEKNKQTVKFPLTRGLGGDNKIKLSLKDALNLAVNNNLDLSIEKDALNIAFLKLETTKEVYYPKIGMETFFTNEKIPTADSLSSYTGKLDNNSFRSKSYLKGYLPLGSSYEISFNNEKRETNNQYIVLSPQYTTNLKFKIEQPLLKDLWIDDNRLNIKQKQLDFFIAQADLKEKLQKIIYDTEIAYWNLLSSQEKEKIAQEALDLTMEQLKKASEGFKTGKNDKIDVISSETEFENKKDELITTQNTVFKDLNSLKLLISGIANNDLWNSDLILTEELKQVENGISLEKALELAFEKRPELKRLKNNITKQIIDQKYIFNQSLPAVNLVGEYRLNGLSGEKSEYLTSATKFNSSLFSNQAASSVDDLISGNFPTIEVGLNISYPVSPNISKIKLDRNRLEIEQTKKDLKNFEKLIYSELLNTLNDIKINEFRIKAAETSVKNAKAQLEEEQKRFKRAESNIFLVLTRQKDLSEARNRLIDAIIGYNKAIATMKKNCGIND